MRASMITSSIQPSLPLAADGEAMARVLAHAGVEKDHTIWVTGSAGLTALIWFNRKGYRFASYAHVNRVGALAPADVLMIPHACTPAELARMVRDARCLHQDGRLIAQVAGELSAESLGHIPSLLAPLGYDVQRRLYEKGRTICVARRRGRPDLSVAA
jgi:hypothetical protein